MSAGHVLIAGVIAFALAALLNAETLVEMAERQPFGWQRTVLLWSAERLHTVSRWTLLDRPGELVDEIRGRNRDAPIDLAELEAAATTLTVPPAGTPTTAPASDSSPEATTVDPATATTVAPPSSVPTTLVRVPTAEAPLRLWVGGDSMAQVFGQSLVRMAGETGVMQPTLDYRISTGLTRPDYFDWPAHFLDVVQGSDPEVMVVMFGANDAQRMDLNGQIVDVTDPPWQEEYRRRVSVVMDFLSQGRKLIWVGQPVMESARFSDRMRILNSIYAEEAAKRPDVTFVDSWSLFADAGGGYTAFIDDGNGPQLMRQQDGIHLSRAGGDRLARAVLDEIEREIDRAR